MKKSSDIIGNRTRDLPACSAVPQPTAPPCAPGRDPVRSKIVINSNIIEQTLSVTQVALFHIRVKKILLLKYQNFSR